MTQFMQIATDTATLVIYDLDQLQHRIDDDCDWWVDQDQELEEINKGNVLFVGLDEDGFYDIEIKSGSPEQELDDVVSARLKNSSGRFFIGPGEAVTGEGEEPEESRYGHFFKVPPGDYEVSVAADEDHKLLIWLNPAEKFEPNHFADPPALNYGEISYGDMAPVSEQGAGLVLDRVCDHLEQLGYQLDENNTEDLIYFHDSYGYVLVEIFEGGIRLATTVAYEIGSDQNLVSYEEWHAKLLEVLDRFNANATVARAYNNMEGREVVFDTWYPPIYTEAQFDVFLDLWHEDVLNKLEEAQNEVFTPHQTH